MTESEVRIHELKRIIDFEEKVLGYSAYLNSADSISRMMRRGFIGRAKLRIKQLEEEN